ncbi:MAG: DNRLRE domain-containing protein [Fibrobacterales bacterium]
MIQLLLLICSCILLSCSLSEGTVDDSNSLTGIVIVGGQPIAAKVALVHYGDHRTVITETESDSTGHYLITEIPAGRYTVVSTVDWTYGSVTEGFTITDNEDATLHINLREFKSYTYDFGDEDIDVYFYHIPIESYATDHTLFYLDDVVNYFTVDDASVITTYTLSDLQVSLAEALPTQEASRVSSSSSEEVSLITSSSSIKVIPPEVKSITLYTDKDAIVENNNEVIQMSRINSGNTSRLHIGHKSYLISEEIITSKLLIEFALSAIPDNATISTAFLTLTPATSEYITHPNSLYMFGIHKLLKSWTEGSNDRERYQDTEPFGVTALDRFGGQYGEESNWSQLMVGENDDDASSKIYSSLSREEAPPAECCIFSITTLVQEWLDDSTTNYGLLISNSRVINESDSIHSFLDVHSSEAENEADRPKLEITYSVSNSLK